MQTQVKYLKNRPVEDDDDDDDDIGADDAEKIIAGLKALESGNDKADADGGDVANSQQEPIEKTESAGNTENTEDKEKEKETETNEENKEKNGDFDMDTFISSRDVQEDNDILSLRKGLEFCTSALDCIKVLAESMPKIMAMLHSKTTSEVVEAIKFFSRTVNFMVRGSLKCYTRTSRSRL